MKKIAMVLLLLIVVAVASGCIGQTAEPTGNGFDEQLGSDITDIDNLEDNLSEPDLDLDIIG